ncbi:unnamed protein product, partial [Strongylus vulgaris]
DFIVSLYKRAENYVLNNHHRQTDAEIEQIREYREAIETIYHLRGERRHSRSQTVQHVSEEAPTLVLNETDVIDATPIIQIANQQVIPSKDELYAVYEKALERHKKIVMKRQKTIEQLEDPQIPEFVVTAAENSEEEVIVAEQLEKVPRISSNCSTSAQPQPTVLTCEAELKQVLENLNPVSLKEKIEAKIEESEVEEVTEPKMRPAVTSKHCPERRNTVATVPTLREVAGKDVIVLDKFDFIGEFERRCGRKKAAPGLRMNLPVIGKPQKDNIQSYRRKGLFDDVDYRRPPNLHKFHSLDKDDRIAAAHSIYTCEEEKELEGEATNEDIQNNNNSFESYLTGKIIRAVLAEKPVSPISPTRRMSMIS